MTEKEILSLREEWKELYSKTLPALARAKDKAQPRWPVSLDHCFARIILDNAIGQGTQQWDKVIKKPAVQNMSPAQLREAIDLGRDIEAGRIDICELDQISLSCRGKNPGKYSEEDDNSGSKRKRADDESKAGAANKAKKTAKKQATINFSDNKSPLQAKMTTKHEDQPTDSFFAETLQRIRTHAKLTPYRKRLYTILLSVPRGRYTTYAAMSDYLKSSARAVGSGMRNNPFAPEVPCHRCLAADGSIGGFHGHWGTEGKYANKKLQLLREEGVRFDGKGKVVGEPFRKFHEFEYLYEKE